ncbi:hypothetical protein DPMN_052082 [Dreissena polymorpha]|uniref:Uncharacterized protein n=1 Tax=Dreissena polymorpha TaxID=45954 RepID=A0A9D4CKB7_DREPO|nr:hypothetical protein DPMN_052082 [Dreissena polymorpha]
MKSSAYLNSAHTSLFYNISIKEEISLQVSIKKPKLGLYPAVEHISSPPQPTPTNKMDIDG